MVVDDLDIMSVPVAPHKAHAPLIIDPDRVLPAQIPLQSLQTVGRWRSEIEQGVCTIQHQQSAPCHLLEAPPPPVAAIASEQGLGPAAEALDHWEWTYPLLCLT